ncbi:MAG: hypothetical protein II336_05460 [Loktanella sp.]|nr:hypothetical protein [Loktanella sp.]
MSNMTRSDDIDDLVSSVRQLVANEANANPRKMPSLDRLVLTPALRVDTVDIAPDPEHRNADASGETAPDDGGGSPAFDDLVQAKPDSDPAPEPLRLEEASEADLNDLAALDGADLSPTAGDDRSVDLETRVVTDIVMQDIGGQPDDAVLRDAVLRVLREELAGDMGERITRNVRKLVRREINRVLAARDFD